MIISAFKDFDVLWLQSTPSIAALFYHKYLRNTHALYCPDDDILAHQLTTRIIAKNIVKVMNSQNNKKVAIHFTSPCSETKRQAIFNFIMKSKPNHASYCLVIPTTIFQSNLLLGWSAEIMDPLWKRRCTVEYDHEAFIGFEPPTAKHGQSEWNEFTKEFVVSKDIFRKKALIVNFTNDMATFQADEGLCFTDHVKNCIKGWISLSVSKPSTLIWIIDEKKLYGDAINNVIQDRREGLLKTYREKLLSTVESFGSSIPIYCYMLDYFTTIQTTLSNCLAQIQHRHHICFSKSILLAWSNDEAFTQDYLFNMNCVYMNRSATFNESKWEDIFLGYFRRIRNNGNDKLEYISPEILDIEVSPKQYKIPLLSLNNTGSLTISEPIGNDDACHTVSAESLDIFNNWAKIMMETEDTSIKDLYVSGSNNDKISTTSGSLEIIVQSLTTEKIKNYVNDGKAYERGELLLNTLSDTRYELDRHSNSISLYVQAQGTRSEPYLVSITINENATIENGSCSCPVGGIGECKHCVAVLLYFLQNSEKFILNNTQPSQEEPILSLSLPDSLSSNSSRKRSFEASQEDEVVVDDKNKKKIKSSQEDNLDATTPYNATQDSDEPDLRSSLGYLPSTLGAANTQETTLEPVSTNNSQETDSTNQRRIENTTYENTTETYYNSYSSSSQSLPSVRSVTITSSQGGAYNSSSLSSSKKSSLSLPTIPSTSSLSDNTRNDLYPLEEGENESLAATLHYDQYPDEEQATLPHDPNRDERQPVIYDISQDKPTESYDYNADEESTVPYDYVATESAPGTLHYDPNDDEEPTQPDNPDTDEDARTQLYNHESDEEAPTQPYNPDTDEEARTQPYNPDTDEEATRPYTHESDEEAPTQPYNYRSNEEESQTNVETRQVTTTVVIGSPNESPTPSDNHVQEEYDIRLDSNEDYDDDKYAYEFETKDNNNDEDDDDELNDSQLSVISGLSASARDWLEDFI